MPNSNQKDHYWVGFFLADGYIVGMESQETQVGLALKDKEHVVKYARHFGLSNKIGKKTVNGTYYWRVHTYSYKLEDWFAKYGIVQNKSLTASAPESLKNDRDFWRGVIDGDGCIDVQKNTPRIRLTSGSKDIVTQFKDFIQLPSRASVRRGDRKWVYGVHANCVREALKRLYDGSEVHLNRKFKKAKRIYGSQ